MSVDDEAVNDTLLALLAEQTLVAQCFYCFSVLSVSECENKRCKNCNHEIDDMLISSMKKILERSVKE